MFVGWEGVGLCSYLLIGFWFLKKTATDAGNKAFIVNAHRRFRLHRRHAADLLDFRHRWISSTIFTSAACRGDLDRQGVLTAIARCSSSAPSANPRSFRSTSGCRTRWKVPRPSAR